MNMPAALLLLACAGCASRAAPPRPVAAPDPAYARVHHDWTRELKLYGELETKLLLRATWVGPQVRRAAIQHVAWRAALSVEEHETMQAATMQAGSEAHEIIFASMRTDTPAGFGAATFGGEADSPWRLRLQVDEEPCALLSVEELEDPDPVLHVLYPQQNAWSDLWRARFDPTCGQQGTATLVVSGPQGAGQVTWELAPAG